MATADEKQAKQDALDASRASVTTGQERLQTEVGQAGAAFPARRLRSAGDLSRYAIGGFLSDPNAPLPVPGTTTKPTAPKATGSTAGTGTRSGSGVAPRPTAAPVGRTASTVVPRSSQTPQQLASGFRGDLGYAPRPTTAVSPATLSAADTRRTRSTGAPAPVAPTPRTYAGTGGNTSITATGAKRATASGKATMSTPATTTNRTYSGLAGKTTVTAGGKKRSTSSGKATRSTAGPSSRATASGKKRATASGKRANPGRAMTKPTKPAKATRVTSKKKGGSYAS